MIENIKIDVETKFLPEESKFHGENIWTYFITITNMSNTTIKLLSRHWQITNGNNETNEVIGDGVVGVQPTIVSGESFEYNSFITFKTSSGMMSGNYTIEDEYGDTFVVLIPPFYLQSP